MLAHGVKTYLSVYAADRHPFQNKVVEMVSATFAEVEKLLEADIATANGNVDSADAEKAKRAAVVTQAEGKLAELQDKLKAAQETHASCKAAETAAKEAFDAAVAAVAAKDAEIDTAGGSKAKLAVGLEEAFVPMKEAGKSGQEGRKKLNAFAKSLAGFDMEQELVDSLVETLSKAPSARGSYDALVLKHVDAQTQQLLAKFDADKAAAEKGKEEAVAHQSATETAHKGAVDKVSSETGSKASFEAAEKAKTDGKAELAAAQAAVKSFEKEMKQFAVKLTEAKDSLEYFKEGPAKAFAELKDLTEETYKVVEAKSYYQIIDKQKCDREVIDACRAAVAGQGDGRVSVDDAKKVFATIADGNKVTRIERWTLRYCFEEFKWTDAAHDALVAACKACPQEDEPDEPAAKKAKSDATGYYEVIDGKKCKRAIVDICREAIAGQGDGRVSVEDAEKIWAKAADGGKVTDVEKWTLRYCLGDFNFTRAAHDYLGEKLAAA
jgi:hypothetical protein